MLQIVLARGKHFRILCYQCREPDFRAACSICQHALADLAGAIKDAGLNISTFHIIERREDYATAAITTDDQERAKTALANRYTVI